MTAVTATAVGFAFDAGGGKELTHVFAALYMIGCLAAVLMVRQSAIFTAVVQPPIILFVSVPGAYFLFHGAKLNGLKEAVINCGYPLIERFPLMLITSGAVLLIGLVRWFVGSRAGADEEPVAPAATPGFFAVATAKIAEIFSSSHGDDKELDERPRHGTDGPTPARAAQPAKAGDRTEPTRRRRSRPARPEDELGPERPRRRTSPARQPDDPVDLPRRRPPAARARNPYERREPPGRRAPHERRGGRHESDEPFEPYDLPARRRPTPNGAAMPNGTHHPISRVRYRGSPTETEPWQERPVRRRPRGSWEAESWEYDI